MRDHIIALILAIVTVAAIELVTFRPARAADNTITVDQIGTGNAFTFDQDGSGHTANVTLGSVSDVDYTTLNILQHGNGAKTATVEVKSGINNTIELNQRGSGNHTSSIISFSGSGNDIKVNQNGSGTHNFIMTGTSTNNGNNIYALQEGATDKSFQLNLNGTTGASVNVQQTNPTTANTGSMSIQCNPCGAYSYIRQ